MPASRKINVFTALIAFYLLPACTTSSYRVIDKDAYSTEFQLTPDRILLECEDIKDHENAGDPEGNFGFMIHVLDEEDTVLTMIQEPVIGRKDCFKRLEAINKVIKAGKSIYIGAHGALDKPRVKETRSYSSFAKKGTFYSNGRSFQFSVIRNEHDQCYSATNATYPPCMPPEFPIKGSPVK